MHVLNLNGMVKKKSLFFSTFYSTSFYFIQLTCFNTSTEVHGSKPQISTHESGDDDEEILSAIVQKK